jgi:hypothetical protein
MPSNAGAHANAVESFSFSQKYYALWGHRRVEGWIEPEILTVVAALDRAQRTAGVSGGMVEIGVHHGRLFLGMHLLRRDSEKSLAIDLFGHQEQNIDASGKGDEAVFRKNLQRYAGGEQDVLVVTGDSTELSGADIRRMLDGPARLFDVDGGHTREIVAHDMQTAADSLVEGGVVLGDDFFNAQWPGVSEGTLQFLSTSDELVPFGIGFNKVMFTTSDYAETYRRTLRDSAKQRLWACKDSSMQGHGVTIVWRRALRRKARPLAKKLLRRD